MHLVVWAWLFVSCMSLALLWHSHASKVRRQAAAVIGPGIDSELPRKVDQARRKCGHLPREGEIGIRLMEGDGVGPDGVPWVDVSLDPSTGHRLCRHRAMVNRTAVDPRTPLGSAPRPLRGPFTRWPRAADAVLATVAFLASVLSSEDPNQDFVIPALGDIPIAGYVLFAVASGALYCAGPGRCLCWG